MHNHSLSNIFFINVAICNIKFICILAFSVSPNQEDSYGIGIFTVQEYSNLKATYNLLLYKSISLFIRSVFLNGNISVIAVTYIHISLNHFRFPLSPPYLVNTTLLFIDYNSILISKHPPILCVHHYFCDHYSFDNGKYMLIHVPISLSIFSPLVFGYINSNRFATF